MDKPVRIVWENEKLSAEATCPACGKKCTKDLPLTFEQFIKGWRRRVTYLDYIQDCFPTLDADQREIFMTSTCTECWEKS